MVNRKELDHLLGMYEMENAIETMLQKAERLGISFEWVRMAPSEFTERGALVGLCHLLYRELMAPSYPNGEFIITQKLVDLLNERLGWKLPPAPTFMEHAEKRFPFMQEKK